ncbi:hypothetical protein DERF_005632, partial [Dermatophagoides farinae]
RCIWQCNHHYFGLIHKECDNINFTMTSSFCGCAHSLCVKSFDSTSATTTLLDKERTILTT